MQAPSSHAPLHTVQNSHRPPRHINVHVIVILIMIDKV